MDSIYDVQQLLKRFGSIIYVGDRLGDLQLMEEELKQLYYSQAIDRKDFEMAILLIRHEIQYELEKKKRM
ncbi:YqgQ family protein [Caldibacillus thermolactis]|uniref:YqgQ family protein n=1 Tax=Pallidibacillus thermolactis TaxID=251051 RepID=A0ABT2WI92_9BACI|nr:YqgQ family protein [Pallidibacillus thermolactis]MCU9595137.1 YqgQ family protein [Pallidibacillus thermolactis]MCU9600515.1 YqgQ family protein [Pallidibacillus thermolactis subsp. kokeshiiformis]MED1674424.1 YqgQ family protein [Pallidibacillus thermolactis subsp. kokeshiiformis]